MNRSRASAIKRESAANSRAACRYVAGPTDPILGGRPDSYLGQLAPQNPDPPLESESPGPLDIWVAVNQTVPRCETVMPYRGRPPGTLTVNV